jgi:hypothetical protein
VTGDAVFKLGDAFIYMFFGNLGRFMFMAIIAGIFGVSFGMAGLAGNLAFIPMIQREGVTGQLGRGPGGRGMAAHTIRPKQPRMNGRFFMAANARGRRPGDYLVGMAVGTVNGRMSAVQDKEIAVVKTVDQRIPAIMTGKTIISKESGMILRELRLAGGVALYTGYHCRVKDIFQVTILTFNGRFVEIFFVAGQAEVGQPVMFKVREREEGNIGVPSFVFSVTAFTASGVVQTAVQPLPTAPFLSNSNMTGFAPFGRNALPGGVALAAVLFKFSMAVEVVQRLLTRGSLSQLTRTKRPSTAKIENRCQANHQD